MLSQKLGDISPRIVSIDRTLSLALLNIIAQFHLKILDMYRVMHVYNYIYYTEWYLDEYSSIKYSTSTQTYAII